MSDAALNHVVEIAFQLTAVEKARLLELLAAQLAREVESTEAAVTVRNLAGITFEVGSPQDEGGAIRALTLALEEHKHRQRAKNAE